MEAHVKMLGDSAWLVEWPAGKVLGARVCKVHALMRETSNRPPGVVSVVAAFESLAVRYDPGVVDGYAVRAWIEGLLEKSVAQEGRGGELHEIPVCYGGEYGPDLKAVADELGMSVDEVIAIHSGAEYTVAMMGFAPGFPYLTGLPDALHVPRLATPRNRVEVGAVAIAGEQAGIYPCASPGGWRVLGRTDVRLFDPLQEDAPSLLMPGDRVKFVPVEQNDVRQVKTNCIESMSQGAAERVRRRPCLDDGKANFSRHRHLTGVGEHVSPLLGSSVKYEEPNLERMARGDIEVLEPGFATTVQDAGRPFHEHVGVSPGGALDREALCVANTLLGNPENAAALEICVKGPVLRFERASRVVLVGADASGGLRHGRAVVVAAGDVLEIGALMGGLRAVLAVAGGIDVPQVMGSRATDVRAAFGGRVLRVGDRLPIANLGASPSTVSGVSLAQPSGRNLQIRYIDGPQASWFSKEMVRRFERGGFEVTTRQDRMGARLHGDRIELAAPREMRSQPVVTGSIQIPPDGRPMVLFAERQTHGGYPQLGCVITADLPKLTRALPGTRISFRRVTLEDAWHAIHEVRRDLQWLRAGLMCDLPH